MTSRVFCNLIGLHCTLQIAKGTTRYQAFFPYRRRGSARLVIVLLSGFPCFLFFKFIKLVALVIQLEHFTGCKFSRLSLVDW